MDQIPSIFRQQILIVLLKGLQIIKWKRITGLSNFLYVLLKCFILFRKKLNQLLDKVIVSLRVRIVIFIVVKSDYIKTIGIHLLELQLVHNSNIAKVFVQILSRTQPSDIMDSGIKNGFVSNEGL